ncbi:MAG: PorT family protein [Flavobacteriaceae bacterium]|jgi:hypothetical protein|nr:PorT family protein [Flavobacteriaceae bacterium]
MKNILLFIITLVGVSTIVEAQVPKMKYGVKGGLTLATLSDLDDAKLHKDIHLGVFTELKFTEKFSVQPELLYVRQGVKQEGTIYSSTDSYTMEESFLKVVTLSYVYVPIMAKYYLIEGLSVEAGPQVGFLVKDNSIFGVTARDSYLDPETSPKKVDYGLNMGAAYALPNGLFFEARYNLGLQKINEAGSKNIKNRALQLSVGYKF